MAKPKKIYLPEDANHSGIDVTYIKSSNTLTIGGWYDGCVGISGGEMHLATFFSKLGITEKDCRQAFTLLNIEEFNKL
jgi:hypothetical protein